MLHWLYQGLAEPPPAALAQPESITLDKWHQRAPQPVQSRKRIAEGGRTEPVLVPVVPVLPSLATPRSRVRRPPLATWSVAPLFVPEQLVDPVVLVQQAVPRQSGKRKAESGSVAPIYVASAETITCDKWHIAPTQPRGERDSLAARSFWVTPLYVAPAAETVALDWLVPTSVPANRRQRKADSGSTGPIYVQPADTVALDWLVTIAQPCFRAQPLLDASAFRFPLSALFPAPPLTSAGRVWIVNDRPTAWEAILRADDWIPNPRDDEWQQ